MASRYFDELWRWAEDELESILSSEKALAATLPEKNRNVLYNRVCKIYLRYIAVARRLEECYRQMVYVQKRKDIATLMKALLGRIVELKNELATLDFNETPYIGGAINELELAPDQVDPPIPALMVLETDTETETKKQLVARILEKSGADAKEETIIDLPLTWDEAVAMIQMQERARQGRLRFQLMKQIRSKGKGKEVQGRGLQRTKPLMNPNQAAVKLQSVWRSYKARRTIQDLRQAEFIFLGMTEDITAVREDIAKAKKLILLLEQRQTETQVKYEQEFRKMLEQIRSREGVAIKDRFLESIRRWYTDYREKNGKFPELPSEEEGGSKTIHTFLQVQQSPINQIEAPPSAASATRSKPKKEAGSPSAQRPVSAAPPPPVKASGRKNKEDDKPKGVDLAPSQWTDDILKETHRYNEVWRYREASDNETGVDLSLMKADALRTLEEEIRLETDMMARYELDLLKTALDRDRGKKVRRGRRTTRKGKKSKRGRRDKDLTPDRTLQSLVEELVNCGVIRSYPKITMEEFLGYAALVNPMSRKWKRDSFASFGDIRTALIEHCILPLGLREVRQRTILTRSVLLAGPHGVGKTFLVHAICNHLGATLFDLSSASLMARYPGKAGMNMLIHLVTKVSKLVEPSVILVEDIERVFVKKSSGSERMDRKRLRKEIPKLVRNVFIDDRIMMIGTSSAPWECDQKSLAQCFQRMIAIPPPDYGTRYLLWKEFIIRSTECYLPSPAELTNLSRISDSYTTGNIARCVLEVLSERRKQLLHWQPLQADEFVPALARCEPVYKEEEESLRQWYTKTPLRRKRHRSTDAAEGDDEFLAGGEAGKGEGKKKKKKKKKGGKKGNGGVTSKKNGVKKR